MDRTQKTIRLKIIISFMNHPNISNRNTEFNRKRRGQGLSHYAIPGFISYFFTYDT